MNISDLETKKKDLCKLCLYPYWGDCPAIYYDVEFFGLSDPEKMRGIVRQCDVFDLDREEL